MNGSTGRPVWAPLPGGSEALLALAGPAIPRGAVVVLGEMFGTDTDLVHDSLRRLAVAGYLALAPDLTWRDSPRLTLPYDDEGRARGLALLASLDVPAVTADIGRAIRRAHELAPGRDVSLLGFSSGGFLALHAARLEEVAGVAAVYPGWVLRNDGPIPGPAPLATTASAAELSPARVLVAAGTADHLVGADLPALATTLEAAGLEHRVVALPGVGHGYTCAGRPQTYDAVAAERTWSALLNFLDG